MTDFYREMDKLMPTSSLAESQSPYQYDGVDSPAARITTY